MAKKEILSLVTASLLVATLVGCGSSCRPGTDCSDTGGPIDANETIGSIDVTVSDAYVYEASVTKGGVLFNTANGPIYSWSDTIEAAFKSVGGANDTNGNGMADAEDPIAPNMEAKAGSKNINPFTTLEASGITLDAINEKYGIALTTTDVDVTKEDLSVYKAAAKASLELSYSQTNGGQIPSDENTNCEVIKGCISNHEQITPCRPAEVIVCDDTNMTIEPEEDLAHFPADLQAIFATIDAAENVAGVDVIVKGKMGEYNGFFAADSDVEDTNQTTPIRP